MAAAASRARIGRGGDVTPPPPPRLPVRPWQSGCGGSAAAAAVAGVRPACSTATVSRGGSAAAAAVAGVRPACSTATVSRGGSAVAAAAVAGRGGGGGPAEPAAASPAARRQKAWTRVAGAGPATGVPVAAAASRDRRRVRGAPAAAGHTAKAVPSVRALLSIAARPIAAVAAPDRRARHRRDGRGRSCALASFSSLFAHRAPTRPRPPNTLRGLPGANGRREPARVHRTACIPDSPAPNCTWATRASPAPCAPPHHGF